VQGTVTDVTLRKREELSAHRLAVTDSLTGLANREGLHRRLVHLAPGMPPFALVRVDLEGFKSITDALGIPAGDRLLLGVAARLREFLAEPDFAARVGGDEFALVLDGEEERAQLEQRIAALAERLAQPHDSKLDSHGRPLVLGARIGIAQFPADGIELQMLLRRAELALNSLPAASGCSYRFFDPALQAAVEHRRRLEDDLRAAVAASELQLFCQPIVDLGRGRVVGGEALLRWTHLQLGPVSPEVFVPLAEEVGLIGEIGRWVLEEACRNVAAWRAAGLELYMSINVSVRQIPAELPAGAVLEALVRHDLPPEAIAIEITEGVLMSDVTVAQQWIASLRAAGLRVYLDDFGTGYSSLSYLKRFPLDTVKIDKSFIRDMRADNSDYALVEAIITMAESLGLNVVAEGVEDEYQFRLLRQMGCGHGQGYHFSRPVALADFAATAVRIDAELAVADRPA
jgi:diguanylate cyclase (GGDEF)-like protein